MRPVFGPGSCATRKREAKRRKAHAIQCPHRSSQRGGGVEAIHRRQACAVCATYLLAGPLAFRRSAAALAPASERQDSAQAALHAKHDAKALPPLRIALKRGTSRAGRNAGRGSMPGPPGSGVTSPARRNRTRSINWLSPVDVPDVSETARLWSSRRQSQRLCICADESGRFAPRVFLEASAHRA